MSDLYRGRRVDEMTRDELATALREMNDYCRMILERRDRLADVLRGMGNGRSTS